MRVHEYTAYVEFDPETSLYIGSIPSISGGHSQGATLDELQTNLQEVLSLCLEELAARGEAIEPDGFVGIQRVAVNL